MNRLTPVGACPAAPPSVSKRILIWLTALRPRQWTKNGLVFVGLIFSLNLTRPDAVLRSLLAFAVLRALASSA